MLKIDLSEISDVMRSITDYNILFQRFTNLCRDEQKDVLIRFWNEKIVKREVSTWMAREEIILWNEIDFHVVKQEWGNTSGGWGGIGGAAMTSQYTVIIENYWFGFVCVYYQGKLAYICEMDSKYQEYMGKGYGSLPGIEDCRKKLTIIYEFEI
jgi:hypothetical protein